ncbi:DUF4256 domain-containing protein [Candidatus Peregrinibacteria bacterium]|nr:DUF4256 domain-containing protein [Candidatus Peregrinibacteria bacterium]
MEHARQEFAEDTASQEAKATADAKGLIAEAERLSKLKKTPVDPLSLAKRTGDHGEDGQVINSLRVAITKAQVAVNSGVATETPVPAAESTVKAPRSLTPEQSASTLQTLSARFAANENLHEGIDWARVKASLEANPEALWSINEMEKAGHQPDVYNTDEKGFDMGTCSKESPASGRNCVYDEEAAEWLRTNYPEEKFNGSAVAMAEAMGINLMDPTLYRDVLQKKGRFDGQTRSWLLTQLGIRSTGDALYGFRNGEYVYVYQGFARNRHVYGSWRGSLRVEWAA